MYIYVQVSNWFINARVRLWKPMVEEMYTEETKDQDQLKGISGNDTKKSEANKESSSAAANSKADRTKAFQYSKPDHPHPHHNILQINQPADQITSPSFSTSPVRGSSFQGSPKKPRSTTTNSEVQNSSTSILSMDHMEIMKGNEHNRDNDQHTFGRSERQISTFPVGFGTYPVGHLGRFNSSDHDDHDLMAPRLFHGNGVSLTLGLPHCENHSLSSETAQQSFLSNPQNIDPLFD